MRNPIHLLQFGEEGQLGRELTRLAGTDAAVVELSGHPGNAVDPDRYRYAWDYRWGAELDALCSPAVRAAVDRHGFTLGTYRDLGRSAVAASAT